MGELEQAKHGLDLLEKEAGPEVHDLCLDAADTLLEKDLPEKVHFEPMKLFLTWVP